MKRDMDLVRAATRPKSVSAVITGENRWFQCGATNLAPGYVMPAGACQDLGRVLFAKRSDEEMEGVRQTLDRFDMLLEYEYVYGEPASLDTRDEVSSG